MKRLLKAYAKWTGIAFGALFFIAVVVAIVDPATDPPPRGSASVTEALGEQDPPRTTKAPRTTTTTQVASVPCIKRSEWLATVPDDQDAEEGWAETSAFSVLTGGRADCVTEDTLRAIMIVEGEDPDVASLFFLLALGSD